MAVSREILLIGAALACGLLIGIERGWNLRGEITGSRVAGVRTFTLLGLLAGVAGLLGSTGYAVVAGALLLGASGVLVVGYALVARREGRPDATSAIGSLITLATGFLAGIGLPAAAIAIAAVTTLLLALRSEIHGAIAKLDEADVKAFARYAVIAGAIYPFLPAGRYGPFGAWAPRTLWLVVIAVTGFSFLGYIANRLFGARHGAVATAVVGGAYSSTAVTYSFAQRLGAGNGGGAENAGIALATTVMYIRVLILVGLLATSFLPTFAVLVAPALVTAALVSVVLLRRVDASGDPAPPRNPIAILPALSFVAFIAVAAVAARWGEARFGQQGIALLLLITGSMDVDAAIVTAGGLGPEAIAPQLASLALAGTILANMTVKLVATTVYGRKAARPAAFALGASMVVLAATLGIGWLRLGPAPA